MSSWSSVSRASSLWPTSSNASVASWPATSNRTSSPPLRAHDKTSACAFWLPRLVVGDGMRWGRRGRGPQRCYLRVLIYELCAVVDLVMDHHEQILLGVVLRDILVRVLLLRHFGGVLEGARALVLARIEWYSRSREPGGRGVRWTWDWDGKWRSDCRRRGRQGLLA